MKRFAGFDALRLPLRSLKRNRRRNFATGSALALSFAGAVLLAGYAWRVSNSLRVYTIYGARTGHLALYAEGGLEKFPLKPREFSLDAGDQKKIVAVLENTDNVDFFASELTGTGLIGNGCITVPYFARGVSPEIDRRLRDQREVRQWAPNLRRFLRGRGLWEYPEALHPIAVSPGLARSLIKTRVHDEISASSHIRVIQNCEGARAREEIAADANVQLASGSWSGALAAADGEIVAQFTTGFVESDSSAVLMPLSQLQKLLDTDHVSHFSVWLKDPARLSATLSVLRADLAKAGLKVDLYPWNSERLSPIYVGTTQFIYTLSGFIGAVLAAVTVLSIFNSVTITMIEREQEIGTLRAIGYSRRRIYETFFAEFSALTILALLIGALIATAGIWIVNASNIQFNPPGSSSSAKLILNPGPWVPELTAVAVFLLSGLATFISTVSAARKGIPLLLGGSRR